MKNAKFIIVRLVSKFWRIGATFQTLDNWGAATMAIAASLCQVARETFGGEWCFATESATTFTVFQGFTASDFPSCDAKPAAKRQPATVRSQAGKKRKAA